MLVSPKKPKYNPRARRAARRRLVQAIYQWLLTQDSPPKLIDQFLNLEAAEFVDLEDPQEELDLAYFQTLAQAILQDTNRLDALLIPHLDRPVAQLDPIEHAILLLGCYELTQCPDLPWRVAINEAIELAKCFGSDKSYQYINGILDKVQRG